MDDQTPTEPMEQPARWERQEGETPKAWYAFTVYRDAHPFERSLRRVAAHIYGHGTDTSLVTRTQWDQVAKWSSRWQWGERVDAWYAYLDEVTCHATVEGRKNLKGGLGTAVDLILAKVVREAKRLMESDDPMTIAEFARLLPVLKDVGAFARETPQSISEHRHTVEEVEAAREVARERLGRLRLVSGE